MGARRHRDHERPPHGAGPAAADQGSGDAHADRPRPRHAPGAPPTAARSGVGGRAVALAARRRRSRCGAGVATVGTDAGSPRARARRCGRYGAGRRELRGARGRASLIPVPPAWEDAARLAGTGRRSRTRAVVSPRRFRGTAVAASDRSDMAIEVGLTHRTSYAYDRPILLGPQVVRLRPAAHARTRILAYSFALEPAHHFLNWQQDPHGNWLGRILIPEPTRRFEIVVGLVADMAVVHPCGFFLAPAPEPSPFPN